MDSLPIRLAVSLAIGLLVGLERGWRSRDVVEHQRAAGFRTFALIGLLGGLAGAITPLTSPAVLAALVIGFIAVFGAFQWLEAQSDNDLSVTSVVAAILTFLLGTYAVMGETRIAVGSAVAMTVMLALREPLHKWVASLRWPEIRAGLILLAMTFLLLPVLPNRTIDPWNVLNPAEIWLLAILIAAIFFAGYVLIRALGDRLGVTMAAIAGGLASSTATTLTLARLGKTRSNAARLIAGGILLSGTVMLVRVGIVAMLLNPALLPQLLPALLAAGGTMLAMAFLLYFSDRRTIHPEMGVTNPLELGTALRLAALIALVMLTAQAAQATLGQAGILSLAAFSGIADVDAATISFARLGHRDISLETATQAIATAVAVNTVSKAAMAWWVGGTKIGTYVGMASAIALLAGVAAILFA